MKKCIYSLASVFVLAIFIAGCASLAEPQWAKLDVTSDVEQFTDGSMYTTAQTKLPEYVKGEKVDDSRFTEAYVSLKSPQDVKRILIRRRTEDTVATDLNIYVMVDNEWKLVKEIRGNDKSDIDIVINTVKTDKIKIRAQRALRTASGKSAVQQSGGGARGGRRVAGQAGAGEAERILREPLKFAEIEVYGIASGTTPAKDQKK
ncbi:MAG: hypothetical protein ACPL7B_12610 [Candidatus Poribacteria bacterium]